MKKIFAVSLIAMTAVSAANAQIASKAYVDSGAGHYVTEANTAGQNIKALDDQVYANTGAITTLNSDENTPGSVAQQIANAVSTGTSKGVTRPNTTDPVGSATQPIFVNASGVATVTDALGSAAWTDSTAYATAAQGAKADTALQQSNVAQTYSSSDTGPISGAGVADAISDLDLGNTYQPQATAVTHTENAATGSGVNPVYIAANGAATASNSTVGAADQPVYLSNGTITAGTQLGTMAYANTANYYTTTAADAAFVEAPATALTPASGNNLVSYDAQGLVTGGVAAGTMATANTADYYNKTDIGTIDSGKTLVEMINDASAVSNFVEDDIQDAITDKAPSENAVHDALALKANSADLATVATSGAYSDLSGTPNLATVATSGAYSDLSGKPIVDQTYDATSTNAQSGVAVASAISTAGAGYATASQGAKADTALQSKGITASSSNSIVQYDADGLVISGTPAGTMATANTADYYNKTDIGTIPSGQTVISLINAAQTAADGGVQSVGSSGSGNLVQSVTTDANGAVTITVNGTALQDPATSGSDGVYVLTASVANGQNPTYKWEQIARATGE